MMESEEELKPGIDGADPTKGDDSDWYYGGFDRMVLSTGEMQGMLQGEVQR